MNPRSDPEFFDAMFRADPDPWRFDTAWYEIRKRTLLAAMLPAPRYRRALEPGCANGHLTRVLAGRCDHVTATDIAPSALALARARCAELPHVTLREWAFGSPWPWTDPFDLVVLSEVAYYQSAPDLTATIADLGTRLDPGTTVLAAHWRHREPDHHLDGDRANDIVLATLPHHRVAHYRDDDVVIDVLATR
ncbi:class I SAM-dependent methyltransferase [Nocardia harenae]|uniref:class I SAM-dependent methyltransferase n=1 Tax=Nocardia harenae TaxID=358707 RepID=UPI000ACF14C9|nr:SAM-dependent methyltransferase [Nocardia harenae]